MAYLNLDLDYFNHRKAIRLVGILGKGAEFLPIKLWCYVGKYHAEDGKLFKYSVKELESICGWTGKENELIEAMIKTGFIEKKGETYIIHDWKDIQGHIVAFKKRSKIANKKRWGKYAENKTPLRTPKDEVKESPILTNPILSLPILTKEEVRGKPPVGFIFPESLNTPEFKYAWENWQQHRKEIKKPLTPQSIKMQMKEFAVWGPLRSIRAIEFTIKKGWQGIKEDENKQPSHTQTPSAPVKKSFDDIRNEIIAKLEEASLAGGDAVSRCLSSCRDKYRDVPKWQGKDAINEAYDIFKFRNRKAGG